jgi:transposase
MDRESLRLLLAQGLSLAEIGRRFERHESTIAYWVQKHGLEAVNREKHAARSGLTREELEPLVQAGMTIRQLAAELGCSYPTVRYWLMRHGLRTDGRRGRPSASEVQAAKSAGLATARMRCPNHGETEYRIDGRGRYRCKKCRSAAVVRRRRKVKAILVAEAGGRCSLCGYDRNMRALQFHHLDPSSKRHEINAKGVALALETLRGEARKCVLLCSNCHAEVEDRNASVPEAAA